MSDGGRFAAALWDRWDRLRARAPDTELVVWSLVAVVLSALAIPWFLWRDGTVYAGLPVWLWWHVGWMVLAALVFWAFTRRAWGIGVAEVSDDG